MPTRTPTRKGSGRRRVSSARKKRPAKRKTSPVGAIRQSLAAIRDGARANLGRQADDVWGLVLAVFSILIVLAFFGLAGPVGDGFEKGSRFLFGIWRYAVPLVLATIGVALIVGKPNDGARRIVIGGITTFVGTLALFHLLTGAVSLRPNIELVQTRGGAVGAL